MSNVNRKGITYWLEQIFNALSGKRPSVVVDDIVSIDGSVLDSLVVGDKVAKVTGKQKHLYTVTYKGDGVGEGICLTYIDAATVETVAYDYTSNGWVYNSTDHTTLTPDA